MNVERPNGYIEELISIFFLKIMANFHKECGKAIIFTYKYLK